MKRFTLKRMTLSLVISLMFLTSQSVFAQYKPLTVVDGKYSYGQTEKSPGSQAFDKLVDGKESTKWCAWLNPSLPDDKAYPADSQQSANVLYIIVKTDEAVVPTFYFLVNSDGINSEPRNNWKCWKIYAGNFESDEQAVRNGEGWTLVDERIDEPMSSENLASKDLDFNKSDGLTAYQYYWIEITETQGYYYYETDALAQMAEWGLGTHGSFQQWVKEQENQGSAKDEPVTYFSRGGDPAGFNNEGVANLFDGDSHTKWCCSFTNRNADQTKNGGYAIFKASRNMAPSYYTLTTANDTQSNPGRNWQQWRLYGMNAADESAVTRESSSWVLLDDKSKVATGSRLNELPAANYTKAYFTPSIQNTTEYRFFKIEIDQVVESGLMQMADIALGDEYTFALECNAIADAAAAKYTSDTFAEKKLLDEMDALIAELRACTDPTLLNDLNTAIDEQSKKIDASATNYAELKTARNQAILAINAGKLSEEGLAYLTAWISETDAIAPNDEYPIGNYAYLKANRQVTGDEAVAEANRVNAFIINSSELPDPITAKYKFLSGTTENWKDEEGPMYLIDGESGLNGTSSTKWGTDTSKDRFVIFKSINKDTEEDEPIQPTYYGLVTGNDTDSYKSRNWKNWKIWGANFASDEDATKDADGWVLLDSKENVGTDILKTTNMYESYIYLSEGCAEPYKYFKIEVYHDGGMQMNEFTFYNTGNLAEYRESFATEFEEYDADSYNAYKGYRDSYKAKYKELRTTVNAPDVIKIKNELVELQGLIEKSDELYTEYESVFADEFINLNIDSEELTAWHKGYTSEKVGPDSKYIRGTHDYITDDNTLDNDEMFLEIEYLKSVVRAVNDNLYILIGGHTVEQWGDGFYGHLIYGIALNDKDDDGNDVQATKWGGNADADGNTYIIFRTVEKSNPFFYTLTTGNDTGTYTSRNWGTWYIYGGNFEGDGVATKDAEGWVLVDSKENVGQDRLHPVDAEPSYFGFSTETTDLYKYYKVVVTKAYSGKAIQMNEIHFGTAAEFDEIKQEYIDSASVFKIDDVVAEQKLIDNYKNWIEEIKDCQNMEALFRVNYQLETLRDSISACAKVYAKYDGDVKAAIKFLEDNDLEESEALTTLESYLEDDIEPNDVFVHGSVSTILDEHTLPDSVLVQEIDFLESLKRAAVAAGYGAGTDVSSLIINRSFAKAEQVFDNDGNKVGGTMHPEGWDGFVFSNGTNEAGTMSAAEFCNEQSKFNISQTLTGLKNGYYEVKLNAGFRPNGDIKSYNYCALAFANDTKTFVPVVLEGMEPDEEKAWTGSIADKEIYACDVLEPGQEPTGKPEIDSVVVGYVIWGVQGTINAILNNRHEISMVAQVTDGTLKIGLKNAGTQVGGDWLGAGNFRLTYLGEEATAEAIAAAAACNGERVATLTDKYEAGDLGTEDEFKKAPNFGVAQRQALADAASRTTVEQLVADGNLFEEINATKAAYYNLYDYLVKVLDKWYRHTQINVDSYQIALMDGSYDNVAAVDVALAKLLEEYPDYLEIANSELWVDSSEDPFNYAYTASQDGRVIVRLSNMYDDPKENETIIEFEYASENDVENVLLYNLTTAQYVTVGEGKLEATSELKKVSVSVKDIPFTKATDEVGLSLMLKDGAKFNIARMRFVEAPSKSGDLNGVGKVTASDIQVVLNAMAEDINNPAYDLNGDGKVTASDIQVILNIMAEE